VTAVCTGVRTAVQKDSCLYWCKDCCTVILPAQTLLAHNKTPLTMVLTSLVVSPSVASYFPPISNVLCRTVNKPEAPVVRSSCHPVIPHRKYSHAPAPNSKLYFSHRSPKWNVNLYYSFFFLSHYNFREVLAFSTNSFHFGQFLMQSFQLFTPIFITSFFTSSSHLCLCLPSGLVDRGVHSYTFLPFYNLARDARVRTKLIFVL
jgi:hypothetical protein